MGREQGACAELLFVGDELQYRTGDAHTVVGRGTSADLIEDQQALGGRVRNDVGDLVHLHHKGRLTRREIIGSADAGKDRVNKPDLGEGRGHKAAHLRHQHDQRDLAHIGRFTCHIGAGDDRDTVVDIVEQDVIRDEHRVAEQRLHHGMAAVLETNDRVLRDVGAGIAVVRRDIGERYQYIERGDRLGGAFDTVEVECDLLTHIVEQLIFDGDRSLLCAENTALDLFELGRDIALAVGQGLLADVVLRHQILVGIGDLDIVAEDAVVADLQLGDPRLLLLLCFDAGKQRGGVVHVVLELVQRCGVALLDQAAFPHREGRILHDRLIDQRAHIIKRVDITVQLVQELGSEGLEGRFERGQVGHRLTQRAQLTRVGGAVDDLGHQALDIEDAREVRGQLQAVDRIVHQLLDRVLAL